jgi:hypothetical protein
VRQTEKTTKKKHIAHKHKPRDCSKVKRETDRTLPTATNKRQPASRPGPAESIATAYNYTLHCFPRSYRTIITSSQVGSTVPVRKPPPAPVHLHLTTPLPKLRSFTSRAASPRFLNQQFPLIMSLTPHLSVLAPNTPRPPVDEGEYPKSKIYRTKSPTKQLTQSAIHNDNPSPAYPLAIGTDRFERSEPIPRDSRPEIALPAVVFSARNELDAKSAGITSFPFDRLL